MWAQMDGFGRFVLILGTSYVLAAIALLAVDLAPGVLTMKICRRCSSHSRLRLGRT